MRHISGVDVRRIASRGEVSKDSLQLDCDLLCMTAGYMPVYQLACQTGGKLAYADPVSEFAITGLPKNLAIAGSVNGRHLLENVLKDGAKVGAQAAAALGLSVEHQEQALSPKQRVNFDWPIFPHPDGKEFVDFDEDLQIRDIINAIVINGSQTDLPLFHILRDRASAEYLWGALLDAMQEFGGKPVGADALLA